MSKSNIKMCVDLTLPPWMRLEAREIAIRENPENAARGAVPKQKKWAPGRVLRARFLDGLASVQAKVREHAMEWTEYANLGLVFGNDPNAEIRITFAQEGSWSFIGTDNLSIPSSQATMCFGWLTPSTSDTEYQRVVKHEFGHAIGLIHEHQNPDAKIPWDKPVVYEYYMSTQGWSKEEVDVNLFQTYNAGDTQFSAYDPTSIMHYAIDDKLTVGNFSVGWNTKISPTDIDFIKKVYPGAVKETPIIVGAPPMSASIGTHGERDVYTFTITKKGAYVVETKGTTDVFLSLFTAAGKLIAEDDDSGEGFNGRIVATLATGRYTVDVRHYKPTGTGPYSISVKAL